MSVTLIPNSGLDHLRTSNMLVVPVGTQSVIQAPRIHPQVNLEHDLCRTVTLFELSCAIKNDGRIRKEDEDSNPYARFLMAILSAWDNVSSKLYIRAISDSQGRNLTIDEFMDVDWIITDDKIHLFRSPTAVSDLQLILELNAVPLEESTLELKRLMGMMLRDQRDAARNWGEW